MKNWAYGRFLAAMLAVVSASAAASLDKVDERVFAQLQSNALSGVVIELHEQADLSAATKLATKAQKSSYVFHTLRAHTQEQQAGLRALLDAMTVDYRTYWAVNAIEAQVPATALEQIAARPEVARIHFAAAPDFSREVARSVPVKADLEVAQGLQVVSAPQVWELGVLGAGAVVGDHDIGVEWEHPALKNAYRGWDGENADHAYNWHNAFGPEDVFCTDQEVPCDSNGHGTHTTGTMVGDDGVMRIGMAPEAKWIGCRSLLDPTLGVGVLTAYMECMEWFIAPYAAGDAATADPSKAPDVINNSWGCLEACPPTILQSLDEATKAAGIVQVGSAGNEGAECSTIAFPLAIYESTFTVGSTTFDDQMSSFSSRGPVLSDLSQRVKPNVVAPGSNVISSDLGGTYSSKSGTSMAGPHVAGLVALMISAQPELRGQVDTIRQIIQDTALPITTGETCGGTSDADIPNNTFGFGRIDAYAAVQAAIALGAEGEEAAPVESRTGLSRAGGSLGFLALVLVGLGLRRRA